MQSRELSQLSQLSQSSRSSGFRLPVPTTVPLSSVLASPRFRGKLPTPPAQALTIWGRDRLRAAGQGTGRFARLTVDRGKITETPLPRTEGIKGAFTTDQADRYDLEMSATLEIFDARGVRMGHADARAVRCSDGRADAARQLAATALLVTNR